MRHAPASQCQFPLLSIVFTMAFNKALLLSLVGLAVQVSAAPPSARASSSGPCDIYAAGGTPCVAAHSTTRALYSTFNGALYQVIRGSDSATSDIYPLAAGGTANAASQDQFCSGTTCLIQTIYDQSGKGNHLTQAAGGQFSGPDANGADNLASAIGAPVLVNGSKAYGVFVSPGTGYRKDTTNGVATGNQPEGMYAVFDGTHYNGNCCFDYGNAETSRTNTGNGHMEAVYFGSSTVWDTGAGNGPWVMADLENGLFAEGDFNKNNNDPAISYRFVTGTVKGDSSNLWALKTANSQSGGLATAYQGARPNGYYPMNKEGSVLLGIGGDNSNGAQGTFYEGVLTTGYPSDATENSVQANIVAAGYKTTSLVSGPAYTIGSTVTFKATTPGFTNRYLAHTNNIVNTQVITSSSNSTTQSSGSWIVRQGFANAGCYSFESVDLPGSFIRHYGFHLQVDANDNSKQFGEDATYCPLAGLNGQGSSVRSWSYPTRFWRHYANVGYAASDGGQQFFDSKNSYTNDVSFIPGSGFQN